MSIKPMSPLKVMVIFLLLSLGACAGVEQRPEETYQRENEELMRIEKFSSYVRVDGDSLYLKLKTGADVRLTKIRDWLTYTEYEFLDYFKDKGFYHIYVGHREPSEFLMISDKTGKLFHVYDIAKFSPDRKRFVTVSASESFDINGIFIWHFDKEEIVSELHYEPEEYALYDFIEWKDDETIHLIKHTHSKEEYCPKPTSMTVPVTLKLRSGVWTFYDDLSVDSVKCGD